MTESELLDDFEGKVKRYLSALDKSSLIGSFGPAANAYFDAAQNLGASLLLRMVHAYRSQSPDDAMAPIRADLEGIADDELRAAVRLATAMEYAGCDAIAALRGVSELDVLTDEQHALVAAALLAMHEAKPRWASRPEIGRILPNSEGAA